MAIRVVLAVDWLIFLFRLAAIGICLASATASHGSEFDRMVHPPPPPADQLRSVPARSGASQDEVTKCDVAVAAIMKDLEENQRVHASQAARIDRLEQITYTEREKRLTTVETEVQSLLWWIKGLAMAIAVQLIAGGWQLFKRLAVAPERRTR